MKSKLNPSLARAVAALLCCAIAVFGQFNDVLGRKLEAKLKRKHPPEYFVIGTAVKLEIKPASHQYAGLLRARLESGLFAQDSRLKSEESRPETIVVCDITRLDADDSRWEQRTTKEMQKTGTRQDWNEKKKKYETKDVYGMVAVTHRYRIVKGGVNISYHARDARSRQTLDAQNVQTPFSQEYLEGQGSPSGHEVREMLINQAVDQLVKRLTPTTESLTVYLPRGKVENFSKLGQAGLWGKMHEGIDKLGTLPRPSDEAYRQFGLGVANEALAYEAEKIENSIKLFEEAGINYNKALELKPDEKYFPSPLKRLQESLAQYKKLASQQAAYASKAASKSVGPSSDEDSKALKAPVPQRQSVPSKSAPTMTNQKVIELAAKGLDDANIIAAINDEATVQFNLSVDGLVELRNHNVSNQVIAAMRARQSKQTAPKRPTAPVRKKN